MNGQNLGSYVLGVKLTELQTAIDSANTLIAENKAKSAELELKLTDRVKYAYPNGGSEGSEAMLDLSGLYFCDSPFSAGAKYTCFSEYFSPYLMEWVELQSSIYSLGGYGVMAYSRSTQDQVVVATGGNRLVDNAVNGVGWETPGDSIPQNLLKWRVRCVRED